jgi:hypothetical protein
MHIRGICDVQEASVRCWDWNRNIDSKLSEEVSSYIAKKATGVGGTLPDIAFKFKRKNRIVVMHAPILALNSSTESRLGGFLGPDRSFMQDLHQFDSGNEPVLDHLLNFSADPGATTTSIFASVMFKVGKSMDISPAVGGNGSAGGTSVSISSITFHNQPLGAPGGVVPNKYWDVAFKFGSDPANLDAQVEPIDKKGRSVMLVDDAGRPAEIPKGSMYIDLGKTTPVLHSLFNSFSPNPNDSSSRVFSCGVDPKYLSAIRVTLSQSKTVEFKGIPLDPKN